MDLINSLKYYGILQPIRDRSVGVRVVRVEIAAFEATNHGVTKTLAALSLFDDKPAGMCHHHRSIALTAGTGT